MPSNIHLSHPYSCNQVESNKFLKYPFINDCAKLGNFHGALVVAMIFA